MGKGILECLGEGVVLGDGGYVVELERRGYVVAGAFTPEVALTHPDAILQLDREFVQAGAEGVASHGFLLESRQTRHGRGGGSNLRDQPSGNADRERGRRPRHSGCRGLECNLEVGTR